MATILVTGATGLIGKALTSALIEKKHKVIVLTRSVRPPATGIQYVLWDVDAGVIDEDCISKADYIIHLAGANVAEKRWTAKRKQEILQSRVASAQLIVKALHEIPNQVRAIISASAIGWYGGQGSAKNSKQFTETDPSGNDFLATTCKAWETAISPVKELGKRLVVFRTGIVLSREGGAFKKFLKPFKFGVAAVLGTGKQVVSWIHLRDLARLYLYAIENESVDGIYNAVAPGPVTNEELMVAIGNAKADRYIRVHVPAIVLNMALGEMSIEILKNASVSSSKVESTGFKFLYPTIDQAIPELLAE